MWWNCLRSAVSIIDTSGERHSPPSCSADHSPYTSQLLPLRKFARRTDPIRCSVQKITSADFILEIEPKRTSAGEISPPRSSGEPQPCGVPVLSRSFPKRQAFRQGRVDLRTLFTPANRACSRHTGFPAGNSQAVVLFAGLALRDPFLTCSSSYASTTRRNLLTSWRALSRDTPRRLPISAYVRPPSRRLAACACLTLRLTCAGSACDCAKGFRTVGSATSASCEG